MNYVEYNYHKAAFDIDNAVKYLLDKISDIDGGPGADQYMKDRKYDLGYNN